MIKDAENGLMRVIGSGENRWPLVYDRDLADLYVRVLAEPTASGIYHGVDENDETVNDIAEAFAAYGGQAADVRMVPLPEARKKFGLYADALALDQVVRCPRAGAGWEPQLASLTRNVPRLFEEWRRNAPTADPERAQRVEGLLEGHARAEDHHGLARVAVGADAGVDRVHREEPQVDREREVVFHEPPRPAAVVDGPRGGAHFLGRVIAVDGERRLAQAPADVAPAQPVAEVDRHLRHQAAVFGDHHGAHAHALALFGFGRFRSRENT
jgi:hypothetical protein